MKELRNFLTVVVCSILLGSCNSELSEDLGTQIEETVKGEEAVLSVPVNLNISLKSFDVSHKATLPGKNRASEITWKEGDVLYLLYELGDGRTTRGTATYKTEGWVATFETPLRHDTISNCVAYYFDGQYTTYPNSLKLSPTTGIYADLEGTYYYPKGDKLNITCNLKPQTSRIRFSGQEGTKFAVQGLSWGDVFSLSSATLSRGTEAVNDTIKSGGYSTYIYGNFDSESSPYLQLNYTEDEKEFVMDCRGQDILSTGESGYMSLPTASSHNGWKFNGPLDFAVEDVTFRMKRVEADTFMMGKNLGNSDHDLPPVHKVTLTKNYYLGETEVTQALWAAVMGSTPTSAVTWSLSYGLGDDFPAYYVTYYDVQSFLTKLNQLTGENFRLPTEAEWEFAAKGGKRSLGYIYSGGDEIGAVSWYADNSENKTHHVRSKLPNELGLYDMSGNVAEWCSDWYAEYKVDPVVDPIGPLTPDASGSRVCRGGSCTNASAVNRSVFRNKYQPNYRNMFLGFRLALTEPGN